MIVEQRPVALVSPPANEYFRTVHVAPDLMRQSGDGSREAEPRSLVQLLARFLKYAFRSSKFQKHAEYES